MTALAAFAALLHRYTGQPELVVGSPVANRGRAELEGLIGLFINTLVLRIELAGDPSFQELLEQVRAAALGAYVHQDLRAGLSAEKRELLQRRLKRRQVDPS